MARHLWARITFLCNFYASLSPVMLKGPFLISERLEKCECEFCAQIEENAGREFVPPIRAKPVMPKRFVRIFTQVREHVNFKHLPARARMEFELACRFRSRKLNKWVRNLWKHLYLWD